MCTVSCSIRWLMARRAFACRSGFVSAARESWYCSSIITVPANAYWSSTLMLIVLFSVARSSISDHFPVAISTLDDCEHIVMYSLFRSERSICCSTYTGSHTVSIVTDRSVFRLGRTARGSVNSSHGALCTTATCFLYRSGLSRVRQTSCLHSYHVAVVC